MTWPASRPGRLGLGTGVALLDVAVHGLRSQGRHGLLVQGLAT